MRLILNPVFAAEKVMLHRRRIAVGAPDVHSSGTALMHGALASKTVLKTSCTVVPCFEIKHFGATSLARMGIPKVSASFPGYIKCKLVRKYEPPIPCYRPLNAAFIVR